MQRIILFLALALFPGICVAQNEQDHRFDTSRLSEAGRKAYKILLESEGFALGSAGMLTRQEPALLALLEEGVAVEALMSLVDEAGPEGGLYALLGLRRVDLIAFRRAVEKYRSKEEPPYRIIHDGMKVRKGIVSINIMTGCVWGWEDKLKVVSDIESGKYDSLLGVTPIK
jgi:hypothetical protein